MVAFLNNEQGVEVVENVLTEPGSTCYAHAYNFCEVYYLYFRQGGAPLAENAVEDLLDLGILLNEDLDTALWKDAGAIKGSTPSRSPMPFA